MHLMYNFGLKSCEPRAMGTHFVHSYKVATLQLELRDFCTKKPANFELELWEGAEKLRFSNFKLERRECTSSIALVLKIAILQANSGALFAYYFCN